MIIMKYGNILNKLKKLNSVFLRDGFLSGQKNMCFGCGTQINENNNSAAHIIPNALGGRLKPKNILCRECNTTLDNLADNALIRAFGVWPTLLDLPRDHGKNPSKTVKTKAGFSVIVGPSAPSRLAGVIYDVKPVDQAFHVEIGAGDMKVFRQLLNKAKKDFPKFDVQLAESLAKTGSLNSDDPLNVGFDFSPQATFGGIVTAIWLFLILKTGRSFMEWERLKVIIGEMQKNGGTFRYFTVGLPGLVGPAIPIGHKIIIRSVPKTGELIAYVEIMGVLKVGGIFAKGSLGTLVEHVYAFDLVTQKDRSNEFYILPAEFENQVWKNQGISPHKPDGLKDYIIDYMERYLVPRYNSIIR